MQAIKLPVMVIFQDVTPILSLLYSRSKDRTINLQRVKINASLLRFILGLVSLKLEKNPYKQNTELPMYTTLIILCIYDFGEKIAIN